MLYPAMVSPVTPLKATIQAIVHACHIMVRSGLTDVQIASLSRQGLGT